MSDIGLSLVITGVLQKYASDDGYVTLELSIV